MLTHKRLRKLLDYNPKTGVFTWQVHRSNFVTIGKRAGAKGVGGYWVIMIDGRLFLAGRLAFFWMTGRWPDDVVDHINRIRTDNRWSNLREANHSQNDVNRVKEIKGYSFHRTNGCYIARIKVNRKLIHLGSYDSPKEAHAAYVIAARKFFGEFARE